MTGEHPNSPAVPSTDPVTLETLVGRHVLTGVDFGIGEKGEYDDEPPNTCTFLLDGETYTVTEDPSDGYRSSMRDIAKGGQDVSNRFPPCPVLCRMRTSGKYGDVDDVLEMIDEVSGKLVLEIGTGNTDDYYPYFVANFDPTAMEINSGK